jgi:hypothetical protein
MKVGWPIRLNAQGFWGNMAYGTQFYLIALMAKVTTIF